MTIKKKKIVGTPSVTITLFKRGNEYTLEISTSLSDDIWELSDVADPNDHQNVHSLSWPVGKKLIEIFEDVAAVTKIDFKGEWSLELNQKKSYVPKVGPQKDGDVFDFQEPLQRNALFTGLYRYLKTGKE